MKRFYYIGLVALAVFEILNVYFIMPMPGSQRLNSLDIAYFLYTYRWWFRIIFIGLMLVGSYHAFQIPKRWIPVVASLPVLAIIFSFNFKMNAEKMFLQPQTLEFKSRSENTLRDSTVVLVVSIDGLAKAYPLRFIVYHHQVRDTLAGKQIMVTYCSVCRTGRVFNPIIKGKPEQFRLVGMDHFNAMFEDATTKSWWRQATGEAVTGPLKGSQLDEIESDQMTINKFFSLYPFGIVLQAEQISKFNYDSLGKFEWGKSKSKLTGTDSLSWKEKSWVIGVQIESSAKAYDWNAVKASGILHDQIANVPVILVVSTDGQSFGVFVRESEEDRFVLRNDTLFTTGRRYDFSGKNIDDPTKQLQKVKAYQEFWHSWRSFHPQTLRYEN